MSRFEYRTIWISDTHLGSKGARAADLAQFLKCVECERLYLVGDFIDFWRLKSRGFWPVCHNDVIRCILKMIKYGTEVIFVPGNHDEAAREYIGLDIGGVAIRNEDIHETADGRKLLITHGDKYDLVVTHSKLLSHLGGVAYEWLVRLNRPYNEIRNRLGMKPASLSRAVKMRVKSACTYISAFEDALAGEASRRDLDGVVCGHIHKPEIIRNLAQSNVDYFNCGDWIESCTALVEYEDGQIQLIHFEEPPNVADLSPDAAFIPLSQLASTTAGAHSEHAAPA